MPLIFSYLSFYLFKIVYHYIYYDFFIYIDIKFLNKIIINIK